MLNNEERDFNEVEDDLIGHVENDLKLEQALADEIEET